MNFRQLLDDEYMDYRQSADNIVTDYIYGINSKQTTIQLLRLLRQHYAKKQSDYILNQIKNINSDKVRPYAGICLSDNSTDVIGLVNRLTQKYDYDYKKILEKTYKDYKSGKMHPVLFKRIAELLPIYDYHHRCLDSVDHEVLVYCNTYYCKV